MSDESDSSNDEDLSKFKEAVDTTFVKLITESRGSIEKKHNFAGTKKTERYLETSTHYNDVKVPEEMQKRIGAKISAIIGQNVEFVTLDNKVSKRKIKGGIKLFTESKSFLSCDETKDIFTEEHNLNSKRLKKKRRLIDCDIDLNEKDKVELVAVTGEHVMSKEETKYWKSRRKEKLYKYKTNDKSNKLIIIE